MIRATWLAIAAVLGILAVNLPDAHGADKVVRTCAIESEWIWAAGRRMGNRAAVFRSFASGPAQAIMNLIADSSTNVRRMPGVQGLLVVITNDKVYLGVQRAGVICANYSFAPSTYNEAVAAVVGQDG